VNHAEFHAYAAALIHALHQGGREQALHLLRQGGIPNGFQLYQIGVGRLITGVCFI